MSHSDGVIHGRARQLARALLPVRRCAVLLVLAALSLQAACAGERIVFGTVPPSTFQFATVVQLDHADPSGWQVAQVVLLLGRLSMAFPRAATCDVEVGMPVVNRQIGYIPVEMAQAASAKASDKAAREILQRRDRPTASICELFRTTMRYWLGDYHVGLIPGARVSRFHVWKKPVPRRTFPPKRGR